MLFQSYRRCLPEERVTVCSPANPVEGDYALPLNKYKVIIRFKNFYNNRKYMI